MKYLLCVFSLFLMAQPQCASAITLKRCLNIPTGSGSDTFLQGLISAGFQKASPVEWELKANSSNYKFRGVAVCSEEYGNKTTSIRGSSLPKVNSGSYSCYCKVTAPMMGQYWIRSNERPYSYDTCMSGCVQYCISAITGSGGQLIINSLGL